MKALGRGMTKVEASVEVDAPPERVWEVTSDPANLPNWEKHIEHVDLPPGGLGSGSRYTVLMRFMAVRATVRAEVLEWEPPWLSKIKLSGPLEAVVTTSIASLPFGRSVLRHEVAYRFHGLLGTFGARGLAAVGGSQIALRKGALAQKEQAEKANGARRPAR
jgi:uncharacterized protein YndB with AHSA1/START domain